jgi:V-type H+-transporting ATPase subunit E
MRMKNNLMEKLVEETLVKIKDFAKPDNQTYKNLLKNLIIQGMVKLLEPMCYVRVRLIDANFVEALFEQCEREYSELMLKETDVEYKCTLELDKSTYLESP